jgi:hypothetical protein
MQVACRASDRPVPAPQRRIIRTGPAWATDEQVGDPPDSATKSA